ncbi:Tetratricopeptide repeat protein GNN [Platysternon megacephalum]|uniref:Tetratricopeptide repeat protein GNN n=1 Tax=Platysternon megacephalum TaxID=55544 RepID=A0A4D9E3C1_9SAUR|nr:Tetratricopeptide repeat protein GNN [Platysternon megacephalum]
MRPLQLAILATELCVCGMYRNQHQCLNEYLEALSIQELWLLVLTRWIKDYSWRLDTKKSIKRKEVSSGFQASHKRMKGCVAHALCLLGASCCGLADNEILHLLNILGCADEYKHELEKSIATEMLFRMQNSIGELYLETGLMPKGFYYVRKSWDTLGCLPSDDLQKNADRVKQKGDGKWFAAYSQHERGHAVEH